MSERGKWSFLQAYDLLNSTIVLRGDVDEIASTLKGKKSNLNRSILIDCFGKDRCGLTDKVVERTFDSVQKVIPSRFDLIEISFLSEEMKDKYRDLLRKRMDILGFERSK